MPVARKEWLQTAVARPASAERRWIIARAIGSDASRPQFSTDNWGGFLGARQQVVDLMASERAKNPVIVSGDVHNFFANRIFADRHLEGGTAVTAPEIVAGAISSFVRDLSQVVAANSDRDGRKGTVVAHEGKSNGYVLCDLTRDSFDATWVGFSATHAGPAAPVFDRSLKVRISSGVSEPRLR